LRESEDDVFEIGKGILAGRDLKDETQKRIALTIRTAKAGRTPSNWSSSRFLRRLNASRANAETVPRNAPREMVKNGESGQEGLNSAI